MRRDLRMGDLVVLDHVQGVVVVAGAPSCVLAQVWEPGAGSPCVETVQPGAGCDRGRREMDLRDGTRRQDRQDTEHEGAQHTRHEPAPRSRSEHAEYVLGERGHAEYNAKRPDLLPIEAWTRLADGGNCRFTFPD